MRSLSDQEVAISASDRQGSHFESFVQRPGQKEVAEIINNYFINVPVHIGNKIKPDHGYCDQPGVKIIRKHLPQNRSFSFRHINEKEVAKILHSLNLKKRLSLLK